MNEQPDDYIELQRAPEKLLIRRDEQLAQIEPPNLRVEFKVIPSWNNYLSIAEHKQSAQAMVKKWRAKGEEKAIYYARRNGFAISSVTIKVSDGKGRLKDKLIETVAPGSAFQRCEMVLRYWRPSWNTYDVTNPFVKPIIDGFVDAHLLFKDSQEHLFRYTSEFMGVDARLVLSAEAKEHKRLLSRVGKKYAPQQARWWFDIYHR